MGAPTRPAEQPKPDAVTGKITYAERPSGRERAQPGSSQQNREDAYFFGEFDLMGTSRKAGGVRQDSTRGKFKCTAHSTCKLHQTCRPNQRPTQADRTHTGLADELKGDWKNTDISRTEDATRAHAKARKGRNLLKQRGHAKRIDMLNEGDGELVPHGGIEYTFRFPDYNDNAEYGSLVPKNGMDFDAA